MKALKQVKVRILKVISFHFPVRFPVQVKQVWETDKKDNRVKVETMPLVPVCCGADIDFPWHTAGLKFVSQSDIVSK